jgi:FkbM family methyltransferase
MAVWDQIIGTEDLFIDVGANVGGYGLWVARLGAKVIMVEPEPTALSELYANLAINPDTNATVLEVALSDRPGVTPFIVDGTRSRLSDTRQEHNVDVRTLDDIIGDRFAAGVKIDVEGAERLVLEGAERALREHRVGLIQLEWNRESETLLNETREPVAKLLRGCGYELVRATSPRTFATPGGGYCDDLFARPASRGVAWRAPKF